MIDIFEIEEKLSGIKIEMSESLKNFAFAKVGGIADVLVFPKTIDEVKRAVIYANDQDIPWIVLGNVSNVIIRDGGIRGMVIMLSEMNLVRLDGYILEVEAGKDLIELSYLALTESLAGLEFACGIPGSVGGAVFMNAGAYGGEISHVFASAQVLLWNGEVETWNKTQMNFGYRYSVLQNRKAIILSVKFELSPGDSQVIEAQMNKLTHLRELKQPLEYPSCGSVFKRPVGFFTGQLIQNANLQGFQIGGAQISQKHAGFIINVDSATAKDYEELISHIIKVVKEKFNVKLRSEVRIIGESL
jgi:UDP-N-acetylmuramate dehydrogenase